ncbi:MAG: flavin reductase family protein, partial [Eggerthellaceae bacterium]|nr:flavin reductase family protein [Eggerthellaceae bacterium]
MDKTAFRSLTYGMYLVSSLRDGKPVGCVANTFTQVTSSPAQASIALNKDNFTTQGVRETGAFEVAVLDQSASMELIGAFGFHSSADTDKFSGFTTETSAQGIPYVAEQVCARFSVKVEQEIDLGSHVLFIGSVADAASLGGEEPMTYAYYHQVKGGKTPPKA